MQEKVRKTGIEIIGDASWGTHFCQFYQTKEDLIDTLVPYFKAGLENNEFCMWITAEPLSASEAVKAMTQVLPNFTAFLDNGQIEILPYQEWYLKDGSFNSQRVLNGWVEKLNQGLTRGYDGLRLTGNTFWLEKNNWPDFTEYEAAINGVISKYKILALCTYFLDKCNAREIMDVIRNHEFALIKQEGRWDRVENTSYRMAKRELAESEERYRAVVETANEGILISDSDSKILYVNQKMADMLGYTRDELIGLNGRDLHVADQQTKIVETRQRLQQGKKVQHEFKLKCKDGSILWVNTTACPLFDRKGQPMGNLGMHTDISARKKTEAELQYLASFPELNPNPIIEVDATGKVIYMNLSAKTCFPDLPDLGPEHPFLVDIIPIIKSLQSHKQSSITRDVSVGELWFEQTLIDVEPGSNLRIYGRNITPRKKNLADLLRTNRELRAISDCDQAIVRAVDELELSTRVCRLMCEVVGYRLAWVGSVEHDKNKSIRPVAWYGENNGYMAKARITWANTERGQGPTGCAARTGRSEFCQDFEIEGKVAPWRDAALTRGFRSSIAIPLIDNNGRVFAVFTLYASEPNGFNPIEVRLLEELAGDLAFGIIALRIKEERDLAQGMLKENEEKYRSLFTNMSEGFGLHEIILDTRGKPVDYRFLEINTSFEKLTGLSAANVVGRTVKEVLPDIEPQWIETYGRVALTGNPIRFENYSASLNKWYEVYAYSPEKNRFAAIFVDITSRKKDEEAVQRYAKDLEIANKELIAANKEMESFSYTVSHDLKAPLRGLDGFSQALLEDYSASLDEQGKQWLQNIRSSSQHMGRLIDDILALSRIIRTKIKLEKVILSEIAESIAASLQKTEPERSVKFQIRPGVEAIGDINLLSLVFQNLLGNSFKFTAKRQPARIEFGFSLCEGQKVYFVRDNGAGFDMKYADKLFKPFQRLHREKEFPGMGIGLVTVQRIIQKHGGTIWAKSEIGKGATFYFTLQAEKQ